MKKFLSLMFAAFLLLTMMLPAFAAGSTPTETPTLYVRDGAGTPGQELTMDVCIKNNPGVAAIAMKLTYPKETLELVGFTAGSLMNLGDSDVSYGTVLLECKNPKVNMTEDGTLFTVRFKVKDGTAAQDCTVAIGEEGFSAGNAEKTHVTLAKQSGTATVTVAEPTEYNIEVLNGKAFDSAGNEITKAAPGTVVTVIAQEYEACAFDGWYDYDADMGTVTTAIKFADANSTTTTFIMPARDVTPISLHMPVVESITIDKTEITLPVGGKAKITSTVVPDIHKDNVVWSSSNEAVATVEWNGYGEVEAKSVGTAIITAKVGNKSVTCTVTVIDDKIVTIPTAIPGLVYNGIEKQGVPDGGVSYTLTGHKQTNAGTYTATATLNPGYKWNDGTTEPKTISWTIAIKKISIPGIEVWGTYSYTGSAIIPNFRVWDEDHFNSIPADEYDVSVTDNIDAGIGKITITNKKNKENANYEIGTAVQTFLIGKGTQAEPAGIVVVDPTGADTSDGKITGVTTAMEYRKAGDTAWTKVTGTEIAGLAAGNYEVRFAETANLEASDAVTVTVAAHTHSFGTEWKYDATGHWHECSDCGGQSGVETHTFGEWTETKAATETETGSKERICSVCSFKETKEIPVLGHTHKLTVVPEKDATCTEAGRKTYYVCDGCGSKFTDAEGQNELTDESLLVIPAAHHFGEWQEEIPATVEREGVKAHKDCETCGKHFDENGVEITDLTIAKLPDGEETGTQSDTESDKESDTESGTETDTESDTETDTETETDKETETDHPNPPVENKGLSGGAIAGIVIGSVLLVGIGGFAVVWFGIKKKSFADLAAAVRRK